MEEAFRAMDGWPVVGGAAVLYESEIEKKRIYGTQHVRRI